MWTEIGPLEVSVVGHRTVILSVTGSGALIARTTIDVPRGLLECPDTLLVCPGTLLVCPQ